MGTNNKIPKTLAEKFWPNVKIQNGCWPWLGSKEPKMGYGFIRVVIPYKHAMVAHRASWILNFGPIPQGKLVLHMCDNGSCVNPGHLYLGTHKDNMIDMQERERACQGTAHHSARLTPEQVREILASAPKRGVKTALARKFGISASAVCKIYYGKSWKSAH